MKIIEFIAIIAIIGMIGTVTAVDMSIYDRNSDGVIDPEERIILDIDIENTRITPEESQTIDLYTINGTVLLNEEFQNAFLAPETLPNLATIVDVPPVVNPVLYEAEPEPEVVVESEFTTEIPADTDNTNTTFMVIVIFMIAIGGVVIYLLILQSKNGQE